MTRRALTVKLIEAVTSKGRPQLDHFDGFCPGLSIRVTSAKKKTWNFLFTSPRDGKIARLSLGTYPAIGLDDARQLAQQARRKVQQHKDPRDPDNTPKPKTMAELIEDRLSLTLRDKKRSAERAEWRFKKYVTPFVGKIAVENFRIDPHYNWIVDPLLKAGKIRTAGMVFQDLRALMNFAIQRGVIEYSRLAKVKRPDEAATLTRYLSLDEIAIVWRGLDAALPRAEHTRTILRLCLLTGQRLSEVAGMRREEIDIAGALWTIPAARSKNKHSHQVPLASLALKLVSEALRKSNGDYLFPDRSGEGPTKHTVVDYALSNAQKPREGLPMGKFGIPRWTPHDLRRTVGTQLSKLKIAEQVVIGHVLNHRSVTKASITQQIYDQHDFIDEKRKALQDWDERVVALISLASAMAAAPAIQRQARTA